MLQIGKSGNLFIRTITSELPDTALTRQTTKLSFGWCYLPSSILIYDIRVSPNPASCAIIARTVVYETYQSRETVA